MEVIVIDKDVVIARPQRWAVPYDAAMRDVDVDRLLQLEPFCRIDPAAFPAQLPLRGILRHDARVLRCQPGQIIVREGDYGHSVFLILQGRVRVALERLSPASLGRLAPQPKSWLAALWGAAWRPRLPEVRAAAGPTAATDLGPEPVAAEPPSGMFLRDCPAALDPQRTAVLPAGELFGELAALTRSPHAATVYAEGEATLLELRWQGLRDIMRRTDVVRRHVEQTYRRNSLLAHLRETPLLSPLPPDELAHVAAATQFQSHGRFDWHEAFAPRVRRSRPEAIADEPLIVEEGTPAAGVLLIRTGFVRRSRRLGEGHYTLAYLGRGQAVGWAETLHAVQTGQPTNWTTSLRAIGYVDVLLIPRAAIERHVLPHLTAAHWSSLETEVRMAMHLAKPAASAPVEFLRQTQTPLEQGLLEFVVEQRLLNGRQAMTIDLNRCTRCDDCVRACAAVHDGNPRFVRQGPRYGPLQFAQACMHCVDPVCMIGCPTGAIGRDETTGVVRINDTTCIGCATCAQSCPYDNIRMVEIRHPEGALWIDQATRQPILKAAKCDLCADLPGGPACRNACPHDALARLDLSDLTAFAEWTSAHDALR
jgi:Fe-S-cluster-containing dehydrogenase component/CRP-like cAMP-binding protein